MPGVNDGTTTLELLVKTRLDELHRERLASSSAPTQPSVEEQLLGEFGRKLLRAREADEAAQRRKERDAMGETVTRKFGQLVAGIVSVAALFVAVIFGVGDVIVTFRVLAVAAATLGVAAAIVRQLAHGGSPALDGVGKSLGLSSALLAAFATIALLVLVQPN